MKKSRNKERRRTNPLEMFWIVMAIIVGISSLGIFIYFIVKDKIIDMNQYKYKDLGILPLYQIEEQPDSDYAWNVDIPYGILKEYRKYRSEGYKGVIYTYNENTIRIEPLNYNIPAIIVNNEFINEVPSIYYDEEGVNIYGYNPLGGAFQKTSLEKSNAEAEILSPNPQEIPISANSVVSAELKEGYYLSIDREGQPSVYRDKQRLENCFTYINEGEVITRVYVSRYNALKSYVVMLYTDAGWLYIPYVRNREEFGLDTVMNIPQEEIDENSYNITDGIYEFKDYICLDNFKFPVLEVEDFLLSIKSRYIYVPLDMEIYKEYVLEDKQIYDISDCHLIRKYIY